MRAGASDLSTGDRLQAFAVLTTAGAGIPVPYPVKLDNGSAQRMGSIGGGELVRGIAIEP